YILPDNLFHQTPQKGLNEYEMVSKDSIIPLGEEDYDYVIKELIRENVSIYFVDNDMFNKLILNPKQDTMVQSLDKYLP
ncbi:MAG: hypothetical protein M1554_02890, partial [Patescibacteria group bacterium]|nr:hypothetical protein [Patescibacteria group bacterium]